LAATILTTIINAIIHSKSSSHNAPLAFSYVKKYTLLSIYEIEIKKVTKTPAKAERQQKRIGYRKQARFNPLNLACLWRTSANQI